MTEASAEKQGSAPTFYWYDYETFGVDARKSRPAQFAGIRTDMDLKPAGDGEILYCRPSEDWLPSPESCLLTGITPQRCMEKGLRESDFAGEVWQRLNVPGTISIGYNSIGFDDEVNRFLFWRNFLDAYRHSWADGCSRWDLFPLVCAAWALRGETITWPLWEDIDPQVYPKAAGRKGVCFKLEFLTKANGIVHSRAHDALSDVEATIGLARLIAEREPRLWKWALENRTTAKVNAAIADMRPVVWVTPRFGVSRGCTGIAACFYQEKNDCWMWDLSEDPSVLIALSKEELRERLFTTAEARARGVVPLPVRRLKANASPFVCASLKVLSNERAARYGIDFDAVRRNSEKLKEIAPQVRALFAEIAHERFEGREGTPDDPDWALYSSAFPSGGDKKRFASLRSMTPGELAQASQSMRFDDPKFSEMLLRYRARNWPETLSETEREYWRSLCRRRLIDGEDGALKIADYQEELDALQQTGAFDDEAHQIILEELYGWSEYLFEKLSTEDAE